MNVPLPDSLRPLAAALRVKVGFQVVSFTEAPTKLRILGRIPEDTSGLNGGNWKIVMFRLLTAMERGAPWAADLSKNYFKKNGKLVYAHRILLQGPDIAQHYAAVTHIITSSPSTSRAEVTEMPLGGASADRHSTAGGKRGAGPAGTVLTGPAAFSNKARGG